jgi:hypothetical protein
MKKTHVIDQSLEKDEWSSSKPRKPLRRTRHETARLQTLAKLLDPERDFTVERRVILTTHAEETDRYGKVEMELPGGAKATKTVLLRKGRPRQFEQRVFTIRALKGVDATDAADQAKYNLEVERGHHTHAS